MVAVVLALAAGVSWGVADFLGGLNSRHLALGTVLLVGQAVGLLVLLPIAALHGGSLLEAPHVGFAVAGSACGLIGLAALYRGMAVGSVSIVAPISATGAAVPVLFGLARGEQATVLQSVGIGLALVGIVLASRATDHQGASTTRATESLTTRTQRGAEQPARTTSRAIESQASSGSSALSATENEPPSTSNARNTAVSKSLTAESQAAPSLPAIKTQAAMTSAREHEATSTQRQGWSEEGVIEATSTPRQGWSEEGVIDAHHTSGRGMMGPGVGLAFLAALGFGGFFILLHEASARDVLWAATIQRLTGVAIMLLVAVVRRPDLGAARQRMGLLVASGVLDTSANVLYATASQLGLVSLAAVLASLFPVVTVLLARIVLHERLARSQAAGVLCALAGVACIAAP